MARPSVTPLGCLSNSVLATAMNVQTWLATAPTANRRAPGAMTPRWRSPYATAIVSSDATPRDVAAAHGINVNKDRSDIRSGGFVRDTHEAALWCLANTESFAECVLMAVSLGDDTDTTGAVAGALAGIVYGIEGIPDTWLETLRAKDLIDACLF